jgi:signal peptidase
MRRLANAGLILLLIGLTTMALAVVAVPKVTGTQAVTITSNSMQKTLPVGALVYIQPQAGYNVGDIVTFRWNGNLVTHQIVSLALKTSDGTPDPETFITQGTSNAVPDENPIHRNRVVGKVIYSVPIAGLALRVVGTLPVQLFIVLLAFTLWLLASKPTRLQRRIETFAGPQPAD